MIVDWLPWHRAAATSMFHTVMLRGGAFYIDDGLPTPALFQERWNLADVQRTQITVCHRLSDADRGARPTNAWRDVLTRTCTLAHTAARRLAPPRGVSNARAGAIGQKVAFGSGYEMTETGGIIALTYWATGEPFRRRCQVRR